MSNEPSDKDFMTAHIESLKSELVAAQAALAKLQNDYDTTSEVDKRVHARLHMDKAEYDALKAKLARFESAKLPEEPAFHPQNYDGIKAAYFALRTFAAAQTVWAEELQLMFGLARTLCMASGCSTEIFNAAIDAALKESKS